MTRYPVRCCCDGTKLYGFLDVDGGQRRDGERVNIHFRDSMTIADGWRAKDEPQAAVRTPWAEIEFRRFRDLDRGVDEVAVYSDDRPIEFWRTLRGFTELKPVMEFSTRTTIASEMRRENETAYRRALYRPGQVLSMAEAREVCMRSTESVNRTFASDAAAMADQIRRISHPSISPALILASRELMRHLREARDENSPYREPAAGIPQTFHGIEIEEDPSLPEGTFKVFLDWEAAVEGLTELRRERSAMEAYLALGPGRIFIKT